MPVSASSFCMSPSHTILDTCCVSRSAFGSMGSAESDSPSLVDSLSDKVGTPTRSASAGIILARAASAGNTPGDGAKAGDANEIQVSIPRREDQCIRGWRDAFLVESLEEETATDCALTD